MRASDDGMMHAADKPCTIRPAIIIAAVRAPWSAGVRTMSSDPTIDNSDARPEDLGTPEAVGETAEHDDEQAGHEGRDRHGEVGHGLVEAERPLDPGNDVQQVWANSQKVTTARTTPSSQRSLGGTSPAAVRRSCRHGHGVVGARGASRERRASESVPSHAHVATRSVSMPVSSVGWRIGAKRGLWLVGQLGKPALLLRGLVHRRRRSRRPSRTPKGRSTPCPTIRSPRSPRSAHLHHPVRGRTRPGTRHGRERQRPNR